ncbi:MAG TPA: hypothetical protein VL974_07460 [Magnetospirillum sp.]|jgi:hypothetical protein|nr:hypothetical protein [Magnetospirillum sp.]
MNEKQLGLVIITPMIIATGVALWRQHALPGKALVLIAVSSTAIATFLFLNF